MRFPNLRCYFRAVGYVVHSPWFWAAAGCSVTAAVVGTGPEYLGRILADGLIGKSQPPLGYAAIFGFAFLTGASGGIVGGVSAYLIGRAGWWGIFRIREDAIAAVRAERLSGDEISRTVADAEALESVLITPVFTAGGSLVGLPVMAWFSRDITLSPFSKVCFALMVILFGVAAVLLGRWYRDAILRAREARGELVVEAMAPLSSDPAERQSFTEANSRYTGRQVRVAAVTGLYMACLAAIAGLSLGLLYYVSASDIRTGGYPAADSAFTLSILAILGGRFAALGAAYIHMLGASAYARRVFEVIDRPPSIPQGEAQA